MALKFYISVTKRVKTKSQKIFEVNSYVCRSYRRKNGRVKDKAFVRRKFHEFLKIFFKGLLVVNPLNSETF